MRLNGKLTAQEVKDLGGLLRAQSWRSLLRKNLYGLIFIGALLWFSAESALSEEHEHWQVLAAIWAGLLIVVVWAGLTTRAAQRREIAAVNAGLPRWVEVDDRGLRTPNADGEIEFRRWNTIEGWRSAGSVILLEVAENKRLLVLPLAGVPAEGREHLRSLLGYLLGEERG